MDAEAYPLPQDLIVAFRAMVQVLQRRGVRYALIGGVASSYRGQPRLTADLDFLIHVPALTLPGLLDELREEGFDFDSETVIRQWSQEHLTALDFRGVRVDWLKPQLPLFQHAIDSATVEWILDCSAHVASAESLILLKLLAFRDQDRVDIQKLIFANPGQLDLDWIRKEWLAMADGNDPRYQHFEQLVKRSYRTEAPDGNTGDISQ